MSHLDCGCSLNKELNQSFKHSLQQWSATHFFFKHTDFISCYTSELRHSGWKTLTGLKTMKSNLFHKNKSTIPLFNHVLWINYWSKNRKASQCEQLRLKNAAQNNSTPVVSLSSARTQGCLLPWFPLRPSRRKEVWDQGTRIRNPTVKETRRSRWPIRTAARTRSPRPSPTTSTTATGSWGPNRTPTLSCWHPDLRSSRPPRVVRHTGEDLENLAGRDGIFVMYSQTGTG